MIKNHMSKNKLIYLFFFIFFIISILIDYSILINKKLDNKANTVSIIKKSSIIIQFDSNTVEQSGTFYQSRPENFTSLGDEMSKYINYLINESDLDKFHKNNYFSSRYSNNSKDKYFTFDHHPQAEDSLYGKIYFEIDIFTYIQDEAFTNYVLEKLNSILQEDFDKFFSIINNLTDHFITNSGQSQYKEYIKILEKNDYKNSIVDNIDVFVASYQAYDPNSIEQYSKYHIFSNFIPVFTILFILLFFIIFIFSLLKINLKK